MPNYNQIVILGHLTRDPETKTVGEHTVVSTGIAVNNGYGEKSRPCFVDLSAWNKTGAALAKLKKGEAVMITGQLEMDQWEKDGKKNTKHKITVNQVTFLGKKGDEPVAAKAAAVVDDTPF